MRTNESYMQEALLLAKEASDDEEAPVGCVIVNACGEIIGRGRNRRERKRLATAHAELEAIENACKAIDDWRLSGCSLYVTLEPCPMCAGAIIMSRIDKVFFGARDELSGSCGSIINLFMEEYGQKTQVTPDILADECSLMLSEFFDNLRKSKKE